MTRPARQETTRPEVKIAAGLLLAVGSVLILFGGVGCITSQLTKNPGDAQAVDLPAAMLIGIAGMVCWATAFGITRAAPRIDLPITADWRSHAACPMCGSLLNGPECGDCGEKLDQTETR